MNWVKNIVVNILAAKNNNAWLRNELKHVRKCHLSKLCDEEKIAVKNMWKCDRNVGKTLSLYKRFEHFDERFVGVEIWCPYILRILNKIDFSNVLEHKSLYHFVWGGKIPQPKVYINRISGVFYDGKCSVISDSEAMRILQNEKSFIIKPTHDSIQGNNVAKIDNVDEYVIKSLFERYGDDFIVQEVVKQSQQTAKFNKSSLNTFRITTLNINGRTSLCNIIFRCGQGDTCVDNGGAGGIMVGVNENGEFREYGYDKYYNKYYSTKEGAIFKGNVIEQVPEMIKIALDWHAKYLPMLGVAGWDVALDKDDKPVMIEVNLSAPGIHFEQLCTGVPIFHKRTQEVIDYIKGKQLYFRNI